MSDFVTIAEFQYRHEAELAQGFLDDAGIASQVLANDATGVGAGLVFPNRASLLVLDGDAKRSRQVLESAGVETHRSDS